MLQSLRSLFGVESDALSGRATPQAGVIPYVVEDGVPVFLLITSRRTGRWIFPKGACDGAEHPHDCARREAWEEAGVDGEITGPAIGVYRDMKLRPHRRAVIEVELYPMQVSRQDETWPEQDDRTRHWATLAEARRLITTPGLLELAEQAEAHVSRTLAGREPEPV